LNFYFKFDNSGRTCTLTQNGEHNHRQYLTKHLTVDGRLTLDKIVRNDGIITSESAFAGITRRTGEITKPLENINIMLGQSRASKI
jgi:hypothetical protein